MRPGVEIGRQATLRWWCWKRRAGSNPVSGTKTLTRYVGVFYLNASKACFCKHAMENLVCAFAAKGTLGKPHLLWKAAEQSETDIPQTKFSHFYFFPFYVIKTFTYFYYVIHNTYNFKYHEINFHLFAFYHFVGM